MERHTTNTQWWQQRAERLYCQSTYAMRNIKGRFSLRRNMVPDSNLNLHENVILSENAQNKGKHKNMVFLIIMVLKDNWYQKAKLQLHFGVSIYANVYSMVAITQKIRREE